MPDDDDNIEQGDNGYGTPQPEGTAEAIDGIDPEGPFGTPDGSRATLKDLLAEFVDFDGNSAYGSLAMKASDAKVRVIVGKLGAGKTVYMRRLQSFQTKQDSVYADQPQTSVPPTDVIVKVCQWFANQLLTEKWERLWNRAILRSTASHLLCQHQLKPYLTDQQEAELRHRYRRLLDDYERPRSVYSQLRQIINEANSANHLTKYLEDPLWDDLEDLLAEVVSVCPPIFFYLDSVDDYFAHAPMYWLRCHEGLFLEVMRLLRDAKLGGRLHVVICIRDIAMSQILRSEHGPRYIGEPHIRLLTWNYEALRFLLDRKLRRLPEDCFVAGTGDGRSIEAWLGSSKIRNVARNVDEQLNDYILRHTRRIPRDLVTLGNELCAESRRYRASGAKAVPPEVIRRVVSRCARRSGNSQLAQCANQIASDMMPSDAAFRDYSQVYTSTQAYINQVDDQLRHLIQRIGVDRFPRESLDQLRDSANTQWDSRSDLPSVLWQNGLLGYVGEDGTTAFYSIGAADEFAPPEATTYVFHPCLIDSLGINWSGADPVRP